MRSTLKENAEWKEVCRLVERVIDRGPGAARQPKAFQRAERLEDVVDLVVEETAHGVR